MPIPEPIARGAELLAQADLAGAETIAQSHLAGGENPDALHLLALVRIHQERFDDAILLLQRSLKARPGHAHVLLNLGKVLVLLKRHGEAAGSLEQAVRADPALTDAWYELGEARQALGDFGGAEAAFRKVLEPAPAHPFAQMSLGVVIKDDGRPAEAEPLLADGFARSEDPRLKTAFLYHLAFAQYDQGKKHEALANFAEVKRRDPARASVDFSRADLLMELARPDEALALLEEGLSREPGNSDAHKAYNNMLYQLGRDDAFLKSYDRAPLSAPLQLGKAGFLLQVERFQEAYDSYAGVLRRDPADLSATIGAAMSLNRLGRHDEAMAHLEGARQRFPVSVPVLQQLASTALQLRDAAKAVSVAEEARRLAPDDHYGLALMGLAWRMTGDERDEMLNGYDELIGTYDLEAPRGFSDMLEFNSALNDSLSNLHNAAREPAAQSLRGGSQTAGRLFSSRVELVDLLKGRIEEAVSRYIAAMKPDPAHPLRGRRREAFRFAGSWSSRLSSCGFHINHIHPEGWISSCYYVGVPEAVKDEAAKQGWIKFGEPSFATGLGARRAIQPKPGRLVLFPSYMWHGTIPFMDAQPRTTIAFDVVPR